MLFAFSICSVLATASAAAFTPEPEDMSRHDSGGNPVQLFGEGQAFDLTGNTLVFSPRGKTYEACNRPTIGHTFGKGSEFPIDPNQGEDIFADLRINKSMKGVDGVVASFGNFSFPFCNSIYNQASVNIRGDIVFGHTNRTGRTPPNLRAHAREPRISALLGRHRWKIDKTEIRLLKLGDRIVLTYLNMLEASCGQRWRETDELYNSFQVSLHDDGKIGVVYKEAAGLGPRVVGISCGQGKADIREAVMSALPLCRAPLLTKVEPICKADAETPHKSLGIAETIMNPEVGISNDDYIHGFDDLADYLPEDDFYYNVEDPIDVTGSIVGGNETLPGRYSYVVNLAYASSFTPFCGAILLTDNVVLTAAHCLKGKNMAEFEVHVSRHNLSDALNLSQRFTVDAVIQHPEYRLKTEYDYDAALLRLSTPVGTEAGINFPRLSGQRLPDGSLEIIGWGLTEEEGIQATMQQIGKVVTVPLQDCRAQYDSGSVTDAMVCAAGDGVDACQGDSGGPLIISGNETDEPDTVLGLVSWGEGCARPDKPGVFTSIRAIKSWISIVKDAWSNQELVTNEAPSPPARYPYVSRLFRNNNPMQCMATLITPSVIITSSLCRGADMLEVGTGLNLEIIPIKESPIHHPNSSHADLATRTEIIIYRLERPYTHAQAVLLDDGTFTNRAPQGTPVTQLGWSGKGIQASSMSFLNVGSCNEKDVRTGTICAISHNTSDWCSTRAAGAPLIVSLREEYWADMLIGVSKSRPKCNNESLSKVQEFVGISELHSWLNQTLEGWKAYQSEFNAGNFNLRWQMEDRIVAGREVSPEEKYPYSVYLSSFGRPFCGGSLIAPNVVLSAAHCQKPSRPRVQVTMGRHHVRIPKRNEVTLSVITAVVHEAYDPVSKEHDIMLLLLEADAPSDFVPVRLPSDQPDLRQASSLTVMGWGQTGQGQVSRTQQEVTLDFVSRSDCNDKYAFMSITKDMMCAAREGADACKGDSGGPLVVPSTVAGQSDLQVGIVSFGVACASDTYPGVYADVYAHHQWITEQLAKWAIQIPCASL